MATAMKKSWFDVDKHGLANLMAGRSKAFVLYELLQNAWDEQVTTVAVKLDWFRARATIIVTDDNPEGFSDLVHAYTLFARSNKLGNAEKRGRYNMGEKLVLALARVATIETTKGTVEFDQNGRRVLGRARDAGSMISVEIPMSRDEFAELESAAKLVIVPPGIRTTINEDELAPREPIAEFLVTLPTLIADAEGVLRPTARQTKVQVYEPLEGETPSLYEMGIPVVETGDRYHVDVQQKVPLNMNRDNVTPAYLRAVRVAVLNATFDKIEPAESTKTWVREACVDAAPEAVKTVIEARFGATAVAYDPSDPEANKIATAEGRQVVHGGSLTSGEWAAAKAVGLLLPAGKVTPSPKPYHPDGKPLTLVPESEWTPEMRRIVTFAYVVAREILDARIRVEITCELTWPFSATYGPGHLVLNLGRLGHKFFANGITDSVIDLLIHEFGHHYESDHLSRAYNDALTSLGAKMTRLALNKPGLFAN